MWNAHETALLCQLLDSGGLSPLWAEVILLIFHTVTDIIRPDVKNDSDDMDIRQRNDFPLGAFLECCCFSPTYTCPYYARTILMWSWCKTCQEVTSMVPISLETWSLSLAKYLELQFYGGSFNRRGMQGCTHSLHHDHFQYFG
ncbi:hypothetical protein C7M84_003160 [Penaeus vannamei]|uniref:Uncharacterized protein n=1 Tax=Penaeus vannamei TaxID=6689 RepID=A0A3R7MJ89_PENVA|nr:hypothetical protein C7M84_003160 [Penaeus vannamei]